MEDTAIHWHYCQGMSLGPYEGDGVFGYLLGVVHILRNHG